MNNLLLGVDSVQFAILILVLLMIIIGLLSFRYYLYVSTNDGLSFGTGFGVNLLGNKNKQK